MAYQALYRKYRPKNFDEVVGQKQIVQTLQNAVKRDRIAHAYLFSGPRGTGKTSIAKIFARTLNCTGENAPCGECENCRLSAAGTHPDIIEIDAASNNGVEEVRSLIDRVSYSPIEGKYKVYIIDEVHMMTTGAFNALLKTIEEPPKHAVFIFATTEPNKVLPTILSRCQRFDFSRVAQPDIEARIEEVTKAENISIDPDAISLIAVLADGGMRDALSILDQAAAYCPDQIHADSIREIYGLATKEDIGTIFQHLTPDETDQAISHLEKLNNQGMDLKRFTSDFISLLKNSLLLEMSENTNLISDSEKEILKKYFLETTYEKRSDLLKRLMDITSKLNYTSNILDYLETILLQNSYESHASVVKPSSEIKSGNQKPVSPSSEKPSEIQKLSSKKPQVSQSGRISDQFWGYDVSRETLPQRSETSSPIRFDEEMLLGLLVASNKTEKSQDEENLKTLQIYKSDLNYARFAVSLEGISISASGEKHVLVRASNKRKVNEINELQSQEGYEAFTKQLLGKPKQVYALTTTQTKTLINNFKKRAQEKTLPEPYEVTLNLKEQTNGDSSPEEFLKGVFSNIEIVDD